MGSRVTDYGLRITSALLRLGFRLLYNELAWTYDWVARITSVGQWRSWQRAALPEIYGGRVLEVGHGTGDTLLDLLALGRAPVGLDLSPYMGRLAGRKLLRRGLRCPLVRGSVTALPFAPASYHTLLSAFPTEFIFDPQAAAEFYRVLQPGGRLVAVPFAEITGTSPGDRLGRWLFRVTHQAASGLQDEWLQPYQQAGFRASLKSVSLPRGVVYLIIADKPAGPFHGL